jgi:hypothetical protein
MDSGIDIASLPNYVIIVGTCTLTSPKVYKKDDAKETHRRNFNIDPAVGGLDYGSGRG